MYADTSSWGGFDGGRWQPPPDPYKDDDPDLGFVVFCLWVGMGCGSMCTICLLLAGGLMAGSALFPGSVSAPGWPMWQLISVLFGAGFGFTAWGITLFFGWIKRFQWI